MNFFLGLLVMLLILVLIFRKKESNKNGGKQQHKLHQGYLAGLNFLLNEEPDKAVDIFIQMLEVDTDTIETHLALGHLFRKRGEVDRAIRIHQNLIARPNLALETKIQALTALGQDYLSAGVLDRAERVFLEVITLDAKNKIGLLHLRDIYQQEKEWDKAIHIAEKMSDYKNKTHKFITAHYYCEMAEASLKLKNYDQALDYIKQALLADSHCLRANLLQADVLIKQKNYKQAIKYLKKIVVMRQEFTSEVVKKLEQCYLDLNDQAGLVKTLKSMVMDFPCFSVFGLLSKYLSAAEEQSELKALADEFLLSNPSISNLNAYSQIFCEAAATSPANKIIQTALLELKKQSPAYQCKQCGYAGNIFQWQCPSCKYWGKMAPLSH